MRSAIRKGRPVVELEAVDRRAITSTLAAAKFVAKNVDATDPRQVLAAELVSSATAFLDAFPVKQKAVLASA